MTTTEHEVGAETGEKGNGTDQRTRIRGTRTEGDVRGPNPNAKEYAGSFGIRASANSGANVSSGTNTQQGGSYKSKS